MINRRRQEDASCNDPQPVNGEELVLSGKCVQTVFYADPCGIRYKSSAQVSLAGKMTFDKWVRDTVSLPDTQVPYFYRVIRRLIRDNNAFDGEGFLRIAGVKDETDRLCNFDFFLFF